MSHTARYICKECGAESPTGIGYVLHPEQGEKFVRHYPLPDCPNEHLEPLPRPFHGATLIGAWPIAWKHQPTGDESFAPNRWIVLVWYEDQYVTGHTNSLESREWYWGHYLGDDLDKAVREAYKRVIEEIPGFIREVQS